MASRYLIYLIYLVTSISPLHSQPLCLDSLVRNVIARNPNLEATRFRIQAAHEAMYRVQVLDDPKVMIMSDQNKFHKTSEFTPMMSYEIGQMIPFLEELWS